MEKFYTKILGSPVYLEDGARPITTVRDLVIDPADGRVVAVIVSKGRGHVIGALDVVEWDAHLVVNDADAIVEAEEIVRVKEVWDRRANIFEARVETETGKYLGRVVDFVIDSKLLMVKKLYVAKVWLGLLRLESRIIPAKNIVEILDDKIVVKDDNALVKEPVIGEEKVEMCAVG